MPIRVGFLQTSFAEQQVGGGEVHTEQLARGLQDRGHQVTIFTNEPRNRRAGISDLDVREYPTPLRVNPVNELTLAHRAWSELNDCDVVTLTDGSAWRGVDLDLPTVMVFHLVWHGWVARNGPPWRVLRRKPQAFVYRAMEPKVCRRADRIVSISSNIREDIERIGQFDEKLKPIPNGVDTDRFRPIGEKAATFTVHFQGRLVGMKNPDLLVEAANIATEDWQLTIGGDGPLRDRLERLVDRYDLRDRVRFLGYVPDEHLPQTYARSHVFALPSSYEGMPLSVLEAAASGTALVTSPRAATEFVTDEIGRVIEPSPDELARVLDQLARDRDLANRLGQQARERALEYSWPNIAVAYERLYEELTQT